MERRDFIKCGLLTTAAITGGGQASTLCGEMKDGHTDSCRVTEAEAEIRLCSPAFNLSLDTAVGLCARACRNNLTGRTIQLGGGPELEVDLDAAEQRVWIIGWKRAISHAQSSDCNRDPGYQRGHASPAFDDSKWRAMVNLTVGEESSDSFTWGRTHAAIPAGAREKPLSLTIGGFGLFDHRFMRVFINGDEVATRRATGRWHEPLTIDLGLGSKAHRSVRFGQDNVIAVQLSDFFKRPARLEELDPMHGRELPASLDWPGSPAQFEQYLTIGKPYRSMQWKPARLLSKKEGLIGEAIFELTSKAGDLTALVTYRWNATDPVLQKTTTLINRGTVGVRVLNVRLGEYTTGITVSDGEQGFPVYVDGELFMSLAHPYGWAIGHEGKVLLRQYPGALIGPGTEFKCMEAVFGVANRGEARQAFLNHLQARMRRTLRGHDKPYAFYDPFGANSGDDNFNESEEFLLKNLGKVAEGQRDSGCHFECYSLQFWVDYHGDLTQPDPQRFPHGFDTIKAELRKLDMSLGLWIDSSWEAWSVGGNPAVKPTLSADPKYDREWMALCRATEPIKSMYSQAFRYHIRENGVRLLKFDNFRPLCYNPKHDHLLGVYSTEAIGNAVIETLRDLDAENPDVFLMLYWGYKSPWWLLHADTLFESGLAMEDSFPGISPALYRRDSLNVGIDQSHWYAADVPHLGKDSLGVWLSDWGWNSSMGTERWQQSFVMDMCRGTMLAQPWSDGPWLSPGERRQMAEFIALLKGQPDCFRNSRFILGNPWRDEPYGYLCSNGKRAFLALNNCTWRDAQLEMQLNRSWGLPQATVWNLYRWYPEPAQVKKDYRLSDGTLLFPMRPFEVVLLEAVPAPGGPSLDRTFPNVSLPAGFVEASREIPIQSSVTPQGLSARGMLRPDGCAGWLAISVEKKRNGKYVLPANAAENQGGQFEAQVQLAGQSVDCIPVLGKITYAVSWQVWRVPIDASDEMRPVTFSITKRRNEENVELTARAYFVPR